MIYTPSRGPEDWRAFLAEPEKHWRTGFSARSMAHCWEDADGFPQEIQRVLRTSTDLQSMKPLLIIPEHQVPLEGGTRPSQNDAWVLARDDDGLISITIEGKALEPFGPTLDRWGPDSSPGKRARLTSLSEILQLDSDPPGHLRYQLLHRTASALIEADRFHASRAVMLVHAFDSPVESITDFKNFVRELGATPTIDEIIPLGRRGQSDLFVGWVTGNESYLSA